MNKRNDDTLGTIELAKKLGISPERLRYWERVGIVKPNRVQCGLRKFRRFSQEDADRAVLVKKFVDEEKYSLEGAIRKLQ